MKALVAIYDALLWLICVLMFAGMLAGMLYAPCWAVMKLIELLK